MTWILGVCGCTLVVAIVLMIRNDCTYRYRTQLLKRVSEAAQKDIGYGRDWEWRYEEFNRVTYERMMYTFWKPLRSFYPVDPARDESIVSMEMH